MCGQVSRMHRIMMVALFKEEANVYFTYRYIELLNECPALGQDLLLFPGIVIKAMDSAIKKALRELFDTHKVENPGLMPPKKVHVRIYCLPDNCVSHEFPTAKDVGIFTCIRGTVVRTTSAKLLEFSRQYKCSKCKQFFYVDSSHENYHSFPKAMKPCPNLCQSGQMKPASEGSDADPTSFSKYRDYQEIKIQVRNFSSC